MDFPKSVPGVGLVDGRFVNEDPVAGRAGSMIPAEWGNAITDESLNVIKAADLVPEESKNGQLLEAIKVLIGRALGEELPKIGHGRCRLSVESPSSLLLSPFDGNQIIIDGIARRIPLGGVRISNGGLPPNALRYVYVYSSGGVVALELSPTGHTLGPNGVEVKAGDPTRSLVGMIYTTASAQFADSPTQRLCANWFNRRLRAGVATLLADTNFSTVTAAEITASLRVSGLCWSNSGAYSLNANGSVSGNTAGGIVGFEARVNGGVFGTEARSTIAAVSQYECLVSASQAEPASEGLITATAYGYVSAGSIATLYGTATVNLTLQC